MAGKSHFRVRGVTCGKCDRIHTWYKYRVWRDGSRVKEEYIGKCDAYGNMARGSSAKHHNRQQKQERAKQQTYWTPRPHRSPYDILGVSIFASKEQITKAYRTLVKQYHPDIHKHVDPRIIDEINVAHQTLTK